MPREPASPATDPKGSLDDRILWALQGLHGRVAFSGLRRKLGAHPESLARALRRLEREGLVERSDGGYRSLGPPAGPASLGSTPFRQIARIDLPGDIDEATVLARLAGRWFGSLRWVGVVEEPGRRLLAWARRDGQGQVLLGIQRGALRVYVPDSADEVSEDEALAYELLVQAVSAIQPFARAGGTAYFVLPPRPKTSVRVDN